MGMASVDDMPMRWVWIDRVVEFESGRYCQAIKVVSLAELLPFYDTTPATEQVNPSEAGRDRPLIFPHALIIEGMAQTAGILVGEARQFAENVILAKISQAEFHCLAPPGHALLFEACIDRLDEAGATTTGTVTRIDPANSERQPLASIDLLFSHADAMRTGLHLPDSNFVFDGPLLQMLAQLKPKDTPPGSAS